MKIPKRFDIGAFTFTVVFKKKLNKSGDCWGHSYMDSKIIYLATHTKGRRLLQREIDTTFWHEVMHCMLYQMGHTLWESEAFVTAIGENLEQLVRTSQLDELK